MRKGISLSNTHRVILVAAAVTGCATDDARRPGTTEAPAGRRTTDAPAPTSEALAPTGTPGSPTAEPTTEPARPEPRRSFVTIPAIGLRDFPVVRYRGSPDDAPGTALQDAGDMASPRGPRGGVYVAFALPQ